MSDITETRHTEDNGDGLVLVRCGVLVLACGYFVMAVLHRPPLAAMLDGFLLSHQQRGACLRSLLLWSLVTAFLLAGALRLARRRGSTTTLGGLVAALWPLTLLPVAWYVFDVKAWVVSPVLLYAVASVSCAACVLITRWPPAKPKLALPAALKRRGPGAALAVAIIAYVVYVSVHTIVNHHSLGTAAYDLGLQENALWNTLHGDLLFSSPMDSHYLGVHASFILLLIAPLYGLAPMTETLLVLQALVLGLAALPLYLFARDVLSNELQALLLGVLWLSHPAVGGANFYDFHPIAFAPVILFTAALFWWREKQLGFWLSIALLLTVKEEMAIVVVLLGIAALMSGRRRQGVLLIAVGGLAYVVLQHLVIPHFAGGAHSYTWYYTDLIPSGEGPRGLLTTVLLNPVYTLEFALTQPKVLFFFQLFAPLAFLPFLTARGIVLTSYGLAATLLASRAPLHQIGFQYALSLLALGFIGALLALYPMSAGRRRAALAAAAMLAVVTCFHYGMIWPRHNFTGGFHTIDFDYSEADRARYRELRRLVEKIPDGAAVLASENLVPHVARRHTVETTRYVRRRPPRVWDAILVHNDSSVGDLRNIPSIGNAGKYDVEATDHFVLMLRRR